MGATLFDEMLEWCPANYSKGLPWGRSIFYVLNGDKYMAKQKFEYIGKLNPGIAEYWGLKEHANKPIVLYESVLYHVLEVHKKDFESVENITEIYDNLRKIIKKPDYVFYNEKTSGLEYYKNINDTIVVAIRVNFGSTLKVKSFYPANLNKLNNRRSKEEQMIIDGEIDDTLII